MESEIYLIIGILLLLFLLSGFFAGSEAAIFSLSRLKLKKMKDSGLKIAETIEWLLEDPRKLLITILFCNLLVNTLLSSLSTVLAISLAKKYQINEATMIASMAAIITYLLIVISEVTPINLALNFSEFFVIISARPISIITVLLTKIIPIQPVLTWVTNLFIPLFGGEVNQKLPFITHAELYSTITTEVSDGTLDDSEKEIIRSIFHFGNTQVKEIMTPRVDMIAVSSDTSVSEVVKVFKQEGFNRLPVYQETIDNIIGIVHIKTLLPVMQKLDKHGDEEINKYIWEPNFVPETKVLGSLLREFQGRKVQMMIVIDEYGGTEGLVTMEDVIEEIVGEIQDEYDEEDNSPIKKEKDGSFILDAIFPMDDMNEFFDIDIPHEKFETLGGLVLTLLDDMPTVGAKISYESLSFKIISVDNNRILKIKVEKNDEEEEETE